MLSEGLLQAEAVEHIAGDNMNYILMLTKILNFNRLLWWLRWHRRLVFVFGDLD